MAKELFRRGELGDLLILCEHCGTPVCVVADGFLRFSRQHHSERHVTVLHISKLLEALGIKTGDVYDVIRAQS